MKNLIKFFESSRDRTLNDYVFPMLYGMRPSQVEESIVLPTLRKALKKREEAELYVAKLDDVTKKGRGGAQTFRQTDINMVFDHALRLVTYRNGCSNGFFQAGSQFRHVITSQGWVNMTGRLFDDNGSRFYCRRLFL